MARRRLPPLSVTGSHPLTVIDPESGACNPTMECRSVLFPAPFLPIMATISPWPIVVLAFRSALFVPYE